MKRENKKIDTLSKKTQLTNHNPQKSGNDLDRLRHEYSCREQRLIGSTIYSFCNLSNLFILQLRQREIVFILRKTKIYSIENKSILEIGCGQGGVLIELMQMYANPKKLFGIDLLYDALTKARGRLLESPLLNGDGQNLPFRDFKFDLVLQFTAFSSILETKIKTNMASEMLRVLKPDGMIFWYDFWLNPMNKQTKGISKTEIRRLFPGCTFEFHKITLAPPITRRLVPVSWILCMMLEKMKIFNTHYLVAIRKAGSVKREAKKR